MRICLLVQTLNIKTGTGVFINNIIDGVRSCDPSIDFFILTGEDYLRPSIYQLAKNWFFIRRAIRKADIIHAVDGYPYGIIAYFANLGISKPIIITAVGSGSVGKLRGYNWRSILLRLVYGKAISIIAISKYVAGEIKKILPHLQVEVINPGVDYDLYSKEDRETTSIYRGYEYIITQGEFKRRKGYEEILPMMKELMADNPNLRYVIVANQSRNRLYQEKLYKLMEELGIKDKVTIKSDLTNEELRDAYRNATLYLTLPIKVNDDIEGFGMAIMESAAAGTPSIVGMGSGADDAISDGKSGFLVDGSDRKKVLEKIESILHNKEFRKKLSIEAKKWALENSMQKKAKQYIELYGLTSKKFFPFKK